jgi:hypothetical protein
VAVFINRLLNNVTVHVYHAINQSFEIKNSYNIFLIVLAEVFVLQFVPAIHLYKMLLSKNLKRYMCPFFLDAFYNILNIGSRSIFQLSFSHTSRQS